MANPKSAYSVSSKKEKSDTHIIVVWVDNEAGVLARVVGLFSGRGYNIESLAVAEVDAKKSISRITIVTTGPPQVKDQIKLQLKKLDKAKKLCKKHDGLILDKTKKSFVMQVTALRREIDKMNKKLKPLGLISTSRTGAVAMTRGAKIFN